MSPDPVSISLCNASKSTLPEISVSLSNIALAYLASLVFPQGNEDAQNNEYAYLQQYRREWNTASEADDALTASLSQPGDRDRILAAIIDSLGLSNAETITLLLALLVEEDPMAGRLLARLQEPVAGSRPTLGLIESLLIANSDTSQWPAGQLFTGPLFRSGLLLLENQQAPLPEQVIRLPSGLALVLRGLPIDWPHADTFISGDCKLPESTLVAVNQHAQALTRSTDSVLVIRSSSAKEARSVAVELASELDLICLSLSSRSIEREGLGIACRCGGYLPVFEVGDTAGERFTIPELKAYNGPRIVLAGTETQFALKHGTLLHWSLVPPASDERELLWLAYGTPPALAERMARGHIHSSGRIADIAELAKREACLNNKQQADLADIRRAAWEAESGQLGSLAQPINMDVPDEALVLSKTLAMDLQQLLDRCACREHLDKQLGVTFKARFQQGVRCLMVGPSGTGKTMAAGWLATKMGLPLYRVDLAAVVSKYIGETEKNLGTLLSRAEHSEIVLLFDEADSLFGKRTDIKDSSDRFANSQTNYLLQRIEFYRGIVILTSNSRERFDDAFTRRLDRIVEFPIPTPLERRALWRSHLGGQHALTARQLNQLAAACDFSGGHIRNAVLGAAVQAQVAGLPISFEDVLVGLESEYRKLGKQFPGRLR